MMIVLRLGNQICALQRALFVVIARLAEKLTQGGHL